MVCCIRPWRPSDPTKDDKHTATFRRVNLTRVSFGSSKIYSVKNLFEKNYILSRWFSRVFGLLFGVISPQEERELDAPG